MKTLLRGLLHMRVRRMVPDLVPEATALGIGITWVLQATDSWLRSTDVISKMSSAL